MRDLEIVVQKDNYIAGERVYGYVNFECDDSFDANCIHITLYGEETTRVTKGSGDNRRTYRDERRILADRIQFMDDGYVQEGRHRFDFSFQLPENIPSSYSGWHGDIIYSLEVKVEISWARDPISKRVLFITTPLPPDYEQGLTALCTEDGVTLLEIQTEHSSFCIGGELQFMFRVSREVDIRGVRLDLVQKEVATADGRTDTTYSTLATSYFDDERLRRDEWNSVRLQTETSIPPSFRTQLITNHMVLKATLDKPWRFDKTVEVPLISGWCVEKPAVDEDHLFGDF